MVFNGLLIASLVVCGLGMLYRISTWFTREYGILPPGATPGQRLLAGARGIGGVLFGPKILPLLKALILEAALQLKLLRADGLRWLAHMLIFYGFMLLLIMHALESVVSEPLFETYYSTLNPFFFLRNLFGFMVLAGLAVAVARRLIGTSPRVRTSGRDRYALLILAVIMISGVLLEGMKISSHSEFMRMVEDYAMMDDEDEIRALTSYWVEHYGVVAPADAGPFQEDDLAEGAELHDMSCAECHSRPQSAFMGYATAKIISPAARALDEAGGVTVLWCIHFLACFIGLAYLPFSKMFHIVATPISMLTNAVMDDDGASPLNRATRRVMELDACTHCGVCAERCSAAMACEAMGNDYILPSEKMAALKTYAAGKTPEPDALEAILQGVIVCTGCDRCTVACPSGIDLRQVWLHAREDLLRGGRVEPFLLSPLSFMRGVNRKAIPDEEYDASPLAARSFAAGRFETLKASEQPISLNGDEAEEGDPTFNLCFGCRNCTTICPVVGACPEPEKTLGLLPHQIMCCMGLGLVEMASGAGMIWDCLTCYQCQEHCPQEVKVCDIFYRLKNKVVEREVS